MRQIGPDGENINGNGANGKSRPHPALGGPGNRGKPISDLTGVYLLPPGSRTEKITIMEARFVTEFVKDPGKPLKEIAITAGYSPTSAASIASQVLRRPHIIAEIKDQLHALTLKERISIQRMARKLVTLADVDKGEAMNEDGTLKNLKEMPPPLRSLVESYESREIFEWQINDETGNREQVWVGYAKKIKFVDPLKPLDMLSRILRIVEGESPRPSLSIDQSKHYHDNRIMNKVDINILNQLPKEELEHLHRIASRVEKMGKDARMGGGTVVEAGEEAGR